MKAKLKCTVEIEIDDISSKKELEEYLEEQYGINYPKGCISYWTGKCAPVNMGGWETNTLHDMALIAEEESGGKNLNVSIEITK